MGNGISISCVLSMILSLSTVHADNIRIKVDESGRRIYYNIPLPSSGDGVPIYYSSRAADYASLIEEICARHRVDSKLVKAMIQVESNFDTRAVSRKGAMGLMQLMPQTAARYGVREIFDPVENIEGGVKYLKDLLELFGSDLSLAVAAYNAGENTVQQVNGIPNFVETQNYVRKVLALYKDESGYSPYSGGRPRIVTYYKYVNEQGVTHYVGEPIPGVQTQKITFYY